MPARGLPLGPKTPVSCTSSAGHGQPLSLNFMASLDRLKELTRRTGEEDILAVEYPTPRVAISHTQGTIVAVLLGVLTLVGVAIMSWKGVTGTSTADPPAPAPAVLSTLPLASSAPSPIQPPQELVVSVAGHVAKPGLVTLAPGARVADALSAIPPLPDANAGAVNLARKLNDGEQILLPGPGEQTNAPPEQPGGVGEPGGVISLNSATAAQLQALPGVGPATAQAIVEHRQARGNFTSVEQLMEVKGIGPAKFEKLRGHVTL